MLSILKGFYFFAFSTHESRFIKNILPYKVKEIRNLKETTYLKDIKIINVQSRTNESLISALYSLNINVYNDLLLRDSKKVDIHFKNKDFHLILEHNKSCLLSTLILVQYRYLKLHLI